MAHLPSPASASSSTLIVTSLPSKESIQLQVDDISPSDLAPFPFLPQNQRPPHHPSQHQTQLELQRKAKPKPALAITITPNNSNNMSTTTAPNEPKMSAKGFVEPHHGHLPRRSKKREKTNTNDKEEKREAPPDLSRGVTSSTLESGAGGAIRMQVGSPVPVSATTAKPAFPSTTGPAPQDPPPRGQSQPEDASQAQTQAQDPDPLLSSPPRTPPPPIHPYIPRHELLPPVHLTSLRIPPSPPPPASAAPLSLPLALPHSAARTPLPPGLATAAAAADGMLQGMASPAFATPGTAGMGGMGGMVSTGGTPNLPNLPRRKVSAKRNQNQRRQSEGRALILEDTSQGQDKDQEEGDKHKERVVSFTSAGPTGRSGHTREAALSGPSQDDFGFGSTSSQTSASPSASASALERQARTRSRSHSRARVASPTPGPLKLRARSQSRPRARARLRGGLSALDEDDSDHYRAGQAGEEIGVVTPTTSARLLIGQRARSGLNADVRAKENANTRQRSRGVSLPRLRFGESPLRASFTGPGVGVGSRDVGVQGEEDVFGATVEKGKSREAGEKADEKRKRKTEKEKEKERCCLQEVGRASGVEVGFLDWEDEPSEALKTFWGLEEDGGASSSHSSEDKKPKPARRVVLRVIDDSSSSPQPPSSIPVSASSRSSSPTAEPPAQPQPTEPTPPRELELILDLPDDLPAYRDGQTALSVRQIVDGCRFIHEQLSSPALDPPTTTTSSAIMSSSSSSNDPNDNANKQVQTQTQTSGQRKKVRILAPRARPEDAMSVALCYLAYHPSSRALSSFSSSSADSSTATTHSLLESLHRYFRGAGCHISCSASSNSENANNPADEEDDSEDHTTWFRPLSSAHLLYMRLLDEGDGSGNRRGEERDPRGREAGRRMLFAFGSYFEEEADVDVVGNSEDDKGEGEEGEEEYAGIRNEWRGVLSFEGLERVDEAGRVLCGVGAGEEVVV